MAKGEAGDHAAQVGRRIAQARKESDGVGMTQRELADLLGVSERSVAAYESGDVIPYRFMRDLEHYLGKPAVWLLHGTESRGDILEEILSELRALRQEVRKALGS